MNKWPKEAFVFAEGWIGDATHASEKGGAYVEVVPADLARELYEAVGFCARTMQGDYDPMAMFKAISAEELVKKALAHYEEEVGK